MEGVIEGRIVHYVMPGGDHRAAMIVHVRPFEPAGHPGYCNLYVFPDGGNDGLREPNKILWETSRWYSEKHEPGTWHWIEGSAR